MILMWSSGALLHGENAAFSPLDIKGATIGSKWSDGGVPSFLSIMSRE